MATENMIDQEAFNTFIPVNLLTVSQFSKRHSAFSEGGLRHLIFNADKFKFNSVIVRIGRRVLLDEQRFFEWARKDQA